MLMQNQKMSWQTQYMQIAAFCLLNKGNHGIFSSIQNTGSKNCSCQVARDKTGKGRNYFQISAKEFEVYIQMFYSTQVCHSIPNWRQLGSSVSWSCVWLSSCPWCTQCGTFNIARGGKILELLLMAPWSGHLPEGRGDPNISAWLWFWRRLDSYTHAVRSGRVVHAV